MRVDASPALSGGRRRRPVSLLAWTVAFVLCGAIAAAPAMANFGIQSFTSDVTKQDGTPATQAGSHPFQAKTSFTFTTDGQDLPTENVKDVQVDLPAGLLGDPNATPKCTVQQLDQGLCSGDSQVGTLDLSVNTGGGPGGINTISQPLYNMVPPAGVAAQFGTNVLVVNSFVDVRIRTGGDYGLRTVVSGISANLPVVGTSLTLWGVPADPSHDAQRTCAGFVNPCSSGAPLKPLLTMPTACGGPLTTTLKANSWQTPGTFQTASYQSQDSGGQPVGITGCDRLSITPSVSVRPDTTVADSPTGLTVDVHVPQAPDSPDALATPALKRAEVTVPSALALNASTADGLQACSRAQFDLNGNAEPACPDASKIGTAEIDSPLAGDPLKGSIFLAQPFTNEFGSPLAIYVVAEADGVVVKLAGNVEVNPATGKTTTTFDNTPQLPFTDLRLSFFSGPRATFATPESCGGFPVSASFTPWSAASPTAASDAFMITSGCVTGFAPRFVAGVTNPRAGAASPFALSFSRSDADQELSVLKVALPPGLLAKLAGVPECPSDRAATGACPASSQVGTVLTASGPGPHPLFLAGKVYLTGPYKGAPFGLVDVVPVSAGPLSFGSVIVRQTLSMDRHDAHATVVSDPLPTTLFGIIPLRMRRVDINLNRSGFMVNPTNCSTMYITGSLTSTAGHIAPESSRFQVGGCGALAFSPRLTLALGGKGQLRARRHPVLTAVLAGGSGGANLKSVRVTFPRTLEVDRRKLGGVCSRSAAAADACPSESVVGTASVTTPLLDQPLSGKVYLVQRPSTESRGRPTVMLPDLLIALRGQIALDLSATTAESAGHLVTTFPAIPDTPISRFAITINGSSHGLLQATGDLCAAAQHAMVDTTGQNGKTLTFGVRTATACRAHRPLKRTHHSRVVAS